MSLRFQKIFHFLFYLFVFFAIFSGFFYLILEFGYKDRFYPNTEIAGYDLSHWQKDKAKDFLHQRLVEFNKKIVFKTEDFKKETNPGEIGIEIDLDKTINRAMAEESFFKKLSFLFGGRDFPLDYEINYDRLLDFVQKEIEARQIKPYKDATLLRQNEELKAKSGETGQSLDKKMLLALLKENLENLRAEEIEIPFSLAYPRVEESELGTAKRQAKRAVSSSFFVIFEDKKWEINPDRIRAWLLFSSQDARDVRLSRIDYLEKDNFDLNNFVLDSLGMTAWAGENYEKILQADLDRKGAGDFLKGLALEINKKPIDARFQMKEDKLEVLSPSVPGRELLIEGNYKKIKEKIIETGNREMVLSVRVRGAEITQEKINQYGIKELIGRGESNFAGSPANRRHNILTAKDKLQGILLSPNDVFSLAENLGEVNAESGYLPELVIKEKKTIPEFGGGLCQIATTLFRAAMFSGLPVTERQSHAYAVSYYDPQGTDATIYLPHPDLKFQNDTNTHLLIQAKVKGDVLTFEFYGQKDGREIRFEGPSYWDRKSDGSFKASWTQIVEKEGKEERRSFYSFYQSPEKFH